jgi:predicted RNA binding protein YcfA (HicA-like mRNA interferase family)
MLPSEKSSRSQGENHAKRKQVPSEEKTSVKPFVAQKILRQVGFELDRQTGSHQIWKRGEETINLPVHKGTELKKIYEKMILALLK